MACGLVDARISSSEKDLPVKIKLYKIGCKCLTALLTLTRDKVKRPKV